MLRQESVNAETAEKRSCAGTGQLRSMHEDTQIYRMRELRVHMYTEKNIREEAMRVATYEKGRKLMRSDRIRNLVVEEGWTEGEYTVSATVQGSYGESYDTWIAYSRYEPEIVDYDCDCPAFFAYPGMCKHCVGLALTRLEEVKRAEKMDSPSRRNSAHMRRPAVQTDPAIQDLVQEMALQKRLREAPACGDIEITPELHESYYYYDADTRYTLTFRLGTEEGRKYVLKNITEFVGHIQQEETYSYGKQLSFLHCKSAFTEKAWKYVLLMMRAVDDSAHRYETISKELRVSGSYWDQLFEICAGETVSFDKTGSNAKELHFSKKEPSLKIKLTQAEDEEYVVRIPPATLIYGEERLYVMRNAVLYRYSAEASPIMSYMLNLADGKRERHCRIAKRDMVGFCSTVLPELERIQVLDKGTLSLEEYQPREAEISWYLDEENRRVTLKIMGDYGDKPCNLLKPLDDRMAYHDRTKEIQALNLGRTYFPEEDQRGQILYFDAADHDRMYQLLNTGIGQLEMLGTVYATDKIKGRRLIQTPKTQLGVALKSGLLELSVQSESFSSEELSGILDSYRKKKKYYKMKSGDYLKLEENNLATVAELFDGLDISGKELAEGVVEVPKFRACYVDQMLRQKDGQLQAERSSAYKEIIRDMKNVEDSDYAVPASLTGTLREYQKTGFRWLNTLAKFGFGGILADDMGLGKTLQMIAYFLYRKEKHSEHKPSLVICPASLVYNWAHELRRFAPGLTVCVIAGNAETRGNLIKESGETDVWVTSYDTLKRDLRLYADKKFDTQVIDEAQNIKNHGTQAAKAVKKIKADVKFALTGTPIENRLSELWSIFDYLMPGILGTYEKFRKRYELPIVQSQDAQLTERLRKMISPFILRRVKSEVLKELPDKLEQVVYAQMEPEQRKLYEAHALRLMESLKKQSKEEVQKGKLQILAELTRLRQICCAPEMLYENYMETACKIDTCMELVNQAREGGHKVLIFSQFTSLFPLLEERMRQEKITYYKLTGQTGKEERIRMVDAFNTDDVPVFLISLKAGGTGLNLTAASIVIHFDPWWNLAAQNQATDRAHRIGQEKQVVVFQLIAENTIEEKIIDLQARKQKLADQILEGDGLAASALTKEDFMEILKF